MTRESNWCFGRPLPSAARWTLCVALGLAAVGPARGQDQPGADQQDPAAEPDFDPEPVVSLLELVIAADERSARRCLSVLSDKAKSGELKGRSLQRLRERLEPVLAPLLKDAESPLHWDAVLMAVAWKSPAAVESARRVLGDRRADTAQRTAALQALAAAGDARLLDAAATLIDDRQLDETFRGEVIEALARLQRDEVAALLLQRYDQLPANLQPRAVAVLTQRPRWSRALLAAIAAKDVPREALSVNQVAALLASPDKPLADEVRRQWGTVRLARNPQREQVVARLRPLLRGDRGDARAGLLVFDKVCGQCHKLHGKGQDVGPDLTGNGRSSYEQLLSNVLDPSLVIGAAYQGVSVRTSEGRVVNGLVVEDSQDRLVLKLQGGKRETIPVDEIEARKRSEVSLMPEGVEKQLKVEELQDLFALLTLDRHPDDPQARRIPGAGH